jgi:putative polyhydroxyalkanoate system protein
LSRISLSRKHNLSRNQALAAANSVAAQLKGEYGIQSRWDGDTLHFERANAHGTLRLAPKEVQVEVHLGFLLSVFEDSIRSGIEQSLEKHLAAKPSRSPRRKG